MLVEGSAVRWLASEGGQDVAEYGLIALLVSVAAIGAVAAFGSSVAEYWFDQILARLPF